MKGQSENNDLKKKFDDFTYPVSETNWDAISTRLPYGSGNGFLGNKFSNYKASPSSRVWKNIAAVIHPGHKKRPVVWWWYGAAASLLLFIYVGYTIFIPVDNQSHLAEEKIKKEQHTETNKPSDTDVILLAQDSSNTTLITSGSSPDTNTTKGDANAKSKIAKDIQLSNENFTTTDKRNPSIANNHAVNMNGNKTVIAGPHGQDRAGEKSEIINSSENVAVTPMVKIPLRNSEISNHYDQAFLAGERIKIAFAKAIPAEKNKKSTGFYDGTETSSPQEFSLWGGSQIAFANSGNDNNMARGILFESGNGLSPSSVNSTTSFSPPIYYGINGEIKFWKRFAGGLGLGYLRMQTTRTQYYSSGYEVVDEISDNYLSVPIYLKFNFINKPKFAAFTSVGHAFDMMVGQKIQSETYQNAQLTSSGSNRDGHQGNQANIYMGLGMHFKFTNYLGVFTEGSMLHYYTMSKTNFYSQQNYWPALRFGLLISFDK